MDKYMTEETKFWLTLAGYVGGTLIITYAAYKWFAIMVGKEVAKALLAAGIVAIA